MWPLVAGIGLGLNAIGGMFGANAAQKTAEEQLAEQTRLRNYAMGQAAPTTEELSLMGQQLQQMTRFNSMLGSQYDQASKLMEALNPGMLESAKQLTNALNGGKTVYSDIAERQRAQGKVQLQNQMRQQLGGAGAMSTAGQSMLDKYDQGTIESQQNAQVKGMETLGGVLGQFNQNRSNVLSGLYAGQQVGDQMLGNALATRNNMQTRGINAAVGTSTTPYQGASNMGQLGMGTTMSSMGGGLLGLGALMGMGGKKPGAGSSGSFSGDTVFG